MRFALALLLAAGLVAQEPSQVVRGTWTASAGSGLVLRGQWSAQPHPDSPDAAYGSWTILGASGQVVLQGTWSAAKSRGAWRGEWSARTSANRIYSGTWDAEGADLGSGDIMAMLQRAIVKQVAGSWRYGGLSGHWWLQAPPR
jgi:hypothetical protein